MKKFISMVMAAAMVVSLVPATAFAATDVTATAKIVDALELTETEAELVEEGREVNDVLDEQAFEKAGFDAPELQIKITNADYRTDDNSPEAEVTIKLDNAEFLAAPVATVDYDDSNNNTTTTATGDLNDDKDEATFTFNVKFAEDDKIIIPLDTILTKVNAGAEATVEVDSDDLGVNVEGLVFASVLDSGIKVAIDDTTDIAPEEIVTLDEALEIEPAAGETFAAVLDDDAKELTLKLNSGFEFANKEGQNTVANGGIQIKSDTETFDAYIAEVDDNELVIEFANKVRNAEELELTGIKIEATTAKEGDVATITVKFEGLDSQKVEVATVVESGLVISVDEDEDVPEMWSGVSAANDGLTADEDEHISLMVTMEETFVGAYNDKDEIELVLPDGVYVTDVDFSEIEGRDGETAVAAAFKAAYQEGDHKSFVFEKRAFTETQEGDSEDMMIEFELELVADSTFVGDVTLEMLVDGESKGEVVIATFKAPMVVEAQQNDLKIDYRNTAVGTDIVIKEAEAGLWAEGLKLVFGVDDHEVMTFEDDATFTVNEDESDMEISDDTSKDGATLTVEIDKESDDEAGVITISDIELFMERNIPAGAYDLTMTYEVPEANGVEYPLEKLYAPDCDVEGCDGDREGCDKNNDCIIDDVSDWTDVVKEAWINVVTAGREADDASFTTKVVVPVGEAYIVAGEQTIALDVPAYVSEAGYTMLPVRAVATGLGINNNNVLWDQTTKTVTILYGQRIITMVAGQKVVNVNGSVIPASATVEIVDGRAFLPMRDLATALGVTDITWDAATKTATLNGNA